MSPDLAPTLGHRTGRVLAYGPDVEVRDGREALVVRARLPRTDVANLALDGVKNGRYRGWSVEFNARRESRDAEGVRVIESADVPGLALVDSPSFPGSTVEARRRRGRRIRSRVPVGQAIDCKCADGDASKVLFDADAFRGVEAREVTAISRGANDVIASSSAKDSLRLSVARDGALRVALRTLDTEAGRRTAELVTAGVPVFARPVWSTDRSRFRVRDGVAHVSRAWFVYLLVRPVPSADARGLEPVNATEGREAWPGLAEREEAENGRGLGRLEGSSALGAILRPSGNVAVKTRRRIWL